MRDLLGEEKVGDGGEDGHSPAETGHQAGSPEVRHREDVERAADGQISEQVVFIAWIIVEIVPFQ